MSDQLKEIAKRYEASLNKQANAMLRIMDRHYGYELRVAAPGSSWWRRLKVKFWNWRWKRMKKAQQEKSNG
jgi:hypothetical protein